MGGLRPEERPPRAGPVIRWRLDTGCGRLFSHSTRGSAVRGSAPLLWPCVVDVPPVAVRRTRSWLDSLRRAFCWSFVNTGAGAPKCRSLLRNSTARRCLFGKRAGPGDAQQGAFLYYKLLNCIPLLQGVFSSWGENTISQNQKEELAMFQNTVHGECIYGNLLNGEWVESESGKQLEIRSPVDGSLIGKSRR